jgi:hypothetical protein
MKEMQKTFLVLNVLLIVTTASCNQDATSDQALKYDTTLSASETSKRLTKYEPSESSDKLYITPNFVENKNIFNSHHIRIFRTDIDLEEESKNEEYIFFITKSNENTAEDIFVQLSPEGESVVYFIEDIEKVQKENSISINIIKAYKRKVSSNSYGYDKEPYAISLKMVKAKITSIQIENMHLPQRISYF